MSFGKCKNISYNERKIKCIGFAYGREGVQFVATIILPSGGNSL
jgi:hypothetical protein